MNFDNRTLFIGDNLDIMRGMDSETIDLIYLDPPFNTKREYKAPIGSPAEGAKFKDIWTDEDIKYGWYSEITEGYPNLYQIVQAAGSTYDHSMMIYLMAMSIRLIQLLCAACNSTKGTGTQAQLIERLKEQGVLKE